MCIGCNKSRDDEKDVKVSREGEIQGKYYFWWGIVGSGYFKEMSEEIWELL
jgi:hypothetical protein